MPQTTYRTIIEKIAFSHSSVAIVFTDFCRMVACSLALQTREEEYLEVIRPYSKEQLHQFSKAFALLVQEMESHPFTDCLGSYYLEIAAHSSKQTRGEFHTPQEISRLMARITIDADASISRSQPITINEPACGAGGMVLAIAELFAPKHVDLLRVTCQDINPVATDMTYINTSLWGIPAKVILDNAISPQAPQKIWKNIHWGRVGEDQRQQLIQIQRELCQPSPGSTNPSVVSESSPPKTPESEQHEFDLDFGESLEAGLKR